MSRLELHQVSVLGPNCRQSGLEAVSLRRLEVMNGRRWHVKVMDGHRWLREVTTGVCRVKTVRRWCGFAGKSRTLALLGSISPVQRDICRSSTCVSLDGCRDIGAIRIAAGPLSVTGDRTDIGLWWSEHVSAFSIA